MRKDYAFIKQVAMVLLLVFSVHLGSYAQSKIKTKNNTKQPLGKNISHNYERGAVIPAEFVTNCGPYTWPTNGQTYTASGIYTSNGITQSYNTLAAFNSNVNSFNGNTSTNSLGGIPATNPINLTVGSTAVSIAANPGVTYTTSTFISPGTATSALVINLSPGVYGFGANIFATDANDLLTTGNITVSYSTGFVDTRTVSSSNEFFGYTSTTPITSVTLTCANTVAPFKWPTINNLRLVTNPAASLNLTILTPPVTGNYSVCQGQPVSGGLTSNLGGGVVPLPNYTGDNTGGPTYNRPLAMDQGGTCANSSVGTAVQYVTHTFVAPASGNYVFSTCNGATFDTFLALYQSPFNPTGLCAGNTLIESSDDVCGAQSTITATLVGGTTYVLVVSGYANTDVGTYTVTSTSPGPAASVEWYTTSTGGTPIGTGSPFNPVGVLGSGLTNTNTVGTTTFYAQFPGETCRTAADFTVTAPPTPTFTQVAPICAGGTLTALPTTSNNGITGTWSPVLNPTATTTYTFTPDANQCGTTTTMTIVVNPLPNVTFSANPLPVCAGSSTVLFANVTNATPTISTSSQTFNMNAAAFGTPVTTPTTGVLFNTASLGCSPFAPGSLEGKIALIQRGTCAFTVKAQNAQDAGAVGVIIYNNVAGGLIPAGASASVTIPVYGMTLADGQALIAAMTANEVSVTLNPAPPLTYLWGNGSTTQSINTGILNANTDFTVTVTNQTTGCANTVTINVPVTPNTIPTFTQVAAICSGETLAPLPTTSNNGIVGTWSPALDNTTTTTYTFTPTPVAGQCLGTATMTITVNPLTTDGSVTTTACSSYTWPANGVTYTTSQSGITVVTGCNTATLNLTITGNPIDYANLQFPSTQALCQGESFTAYGRVYEAGVTDASQTLQGPGIDVEFGYNTNNTDPATWTNWSAASYNPLSICYPCNDDEYEFTTGSSLTAGTYYFTFRYKRSDCTTWQYGGYPNGFWNGTNQTSGILTITDAPTPTGDAVQTFSVVDANDATLANLVVAPSTVTWYPTLADAQAGTNALPITTVLTSGSTYYAVNTVGACSSDPFGVTVTVTLGNDQFDNAAFIVAPNPTSSVLNISYSKVISEVSITNILGQTVLSKETNATEVQLDLSQLAEATYFLKVTSEGLQKVVKVIKKN